MMQRNQKSRFLKKERDFFVANLKAVQFNIIGVGLLLRKRWSYICFIMFSAYSVILVITNIIVTDNDTLVRAGWRLADSNLKNFRIFQAAVLCLIGLMIFWLQRYRGQFRAYAAIMAVQQTD